MPTQRRLKGGAMDNDIELKYKDELTKVLGSENYHFVNSESNVDKCHGTWYLKVTKHNYPQGQSIAVFKMLRMPGCCGVCISTGSVIFENNFRGKGLGSILNRLRIDMARKAGYGILFCTDVEKNIPQRKILSKNGWSDIYQFNNPRTKNEVILSVIKLTE